MKNQKRLELARLLYKRLKELDSFSCLRNLTLTEKEEHKKLNNDLEEVLNKISISGLKEESKKIMKVFHISSIIGMISLITMLGSYMAWKGGCVFCIACCVFALNSPVWLTSILVDVSLDD